MYIYIYIYIYIYDYIRMYMHTRTHTGKQVDVCVSIRILNTNAVFACGYVHPYAYRNIYVKRDLIFRQERPMSTRAHTATYMSSQSCTYN